MSARRERWKHRIACQPCNRRKVKCDRDLVQPCSNCTRRNHPELCELGSDSVSRAQPHNAAARRVQGLTSGSDTTVQREITAPLPSQPIDEDWQNTRIDVQDATARARQGTSLARDATPVVSHIGSPSMATFIRQQAGRTGYTLTGSLSSILGLENHGAPYPFLDLGAAENHWSELEPILPSPYEVHRFGTLRSEKRI